MYDQFSLPDGVMGCLWGSGNGAAGAPGEEYLTISELAQRLKLKPKTVQNKMASGAFRLGEHYFRPNGLGPRFKWSAVQAWMESPDQQKKPPFTNVELGEGIPMARGYVLGGGPTH
jgi:hypothetical protein